MTEADGIPALPPALHALREAIVRHWGFRSFRPLQEPAMQAMLDGQDSLVVMPTGGGKSLCYQAPALVRGDTTVVVSPLIALMKDQVDSLRACGVPAIQLDSSQSSDERYDYENQLLEGAYRLLFVSPERLQLPGFQQLLQRLNVCRFAIDEAHCISHWGHDFRQDYRLLGQLKQVFPQASLHAFTATATERVRGDIIAQLGLKNPAVLVGNFDRPNLNYRIVPRHDLLGQVRNVLARHAGEAGIIYTLRRKDVDELTADLQGLRYKAMPYHAGMTPEQRKATQNAFAAEKCDLVVATIAFGMGIDRSNIRFVLHASMPKSVEHYQQETGRAGRDGLEAECVLLHSGDDLRMWKWIIEKSAKEPNVDPSFLPSALKHLDDVDRYCRGAVCRHRALVEYFGQSLEVENCGACDLCLGDTEPVAECVVVAQKILSCVARVKEAFGVNHVISVLRGENVEAVRKRGHEQLSTFGLLKEHGKAELRDWIYQLLGQGVLVQAGDEYPILRLNEASWQVMRKERTVRLVQLARRSAGDKALKSKADLASWEGVDQGLFEELRQVRKGWAEAKGVQPYMIFSDATLRELARVRPSSLERLRLIYGIGDQKLRDFGQGVLSALDRYCQTKHLTRDQDHAAMGRAALPAPPKIHPTKHQYFHHFRDEEAIEDIMHQVGRSRSWVVDCLCQYLSAEKPASIKAWVADELRARIAAAAREQGAGRLKPIFIALGEQVSYDEIRIVLAHLEAEGMPHQNQGGRAP